MIQNATNGNQLQICIRDLTLTVIAWLSLIDKRQRYELLQLCSHSHIISVIAESLRRPSSLAMPPLSFLLVWTKLSL